VRIGNIHQLYTRGQNLISAERDKVSSASAAVPLDPDAYRPAGINFALKLFETENGFDCIEAVDNPESVVECRGCVVQIWIATSILCILQH
jgi:hypothetical protein